MKKFLNIVLIILSSITYIISFIFVDLYISMALKIEEWTNLQLIDNRFKVMMDGTSNK